MAESVVLVDLSAHPTTPRFLDGTQGLGITGVLINNQLPAGMTFQVGRRNSDAMITLAGASAAGRGGDALDPGFYCPPADEGLSVLFDLDAPGSFAELVLFTSGEGGVARA